MPAKEMRFAAQVHEGDDRAERRGLGARMDASDAQVCRRFLNLQAPPTLLNLQAQHFFEFERDDGADFALRFSRCTEPERTRAAPACAEDQRRISDLRYAQRSSLHLPYTTTHHALTASTCTPSILRAQMASDQFSPFPSVRKPCNVARSAARYGSLQPSVYGPPVARACFAFIPLAAIF
jgi:hypothetical protein